MKINITSRAKRIGGSLWLHIDKRVSDILEIEEGSIISASVEKLNKSEIDELNNKEYACSTCSHLFNSSDDIPECPVCENTNLLLLNDENIL